MHELKLIILALDTQNQQVIVDIDKSVCYSGVDLLETDNCMFVTALTSKLRGKNWICVIMEIVYTAEYFLCQ